MKILLVSNLTEKKGLYKDAVVLAKILKEWGHEPIAVDFRNDVGCGNIDLAIHLEVVRPDILSAVKRNWWIPNPDWAKPEYLIHIGDFEHVLCKTRDSLREFSGFTKNTILTGFTCEDKLDTTVPRERAFFHAHRGSIVKGTDAIKEAREHIAFPIIYASDLDEQTLKHKQNQCVFHLCPSEYEGWGHALHEAMSVGAVVVSTNIPPMSEFSGIAKLVKAEYRESVHLAKFGKPNVQSLIEAIKWCKGLKDEQIKELGEESRKAYEDETKEFKRIFGELIGYNPKLETEPPKAFDKDSVSVIVATFGDKEHWDTVAQRALSSINAQTRKPDEVIRIHRDTLAEARNEGVAEAHGEWIIFCDADDELDPYYLASMLSGKGDLRYPKVEVYNEQGDKKGIPQYTNLLQGNSIVIGAMFRKVDFERTDGFDTTLPILEDWDLWIRMWLNGAKVEPSLAIYKVHFNPNGRNRQSTSENWVERIRTKYTPIAKQRGLLKF